MTRKRGAAGFLGGGMLLAWLAVAATEPGTAPQRPASPPPPERPAFEAAAAEVEAQASRLRARLRAAPRPRQPSRNPFGFSSPSAPAAPALPTVSPSEPPVESPLGPTLPALDLLGIAADVDRPSGDTVRTAVIAGRDWLWLVREGESIGSDLEVRRIGEDVVELTVRGDGRVVRLALR